MDEPTKTPGEPGSFDAFLSYNSRDRPAVLAVRRHLQERGLATFFDRETIPLGGSWFEALESGVSRSRAVVVFLGPNGLGIWQKREMALALHRQAVGEKTGDRVLVVPVLLPGFSYQDPPGFLMLNNGLDLRAGLDDAGELDALARAARGEPPAPRPDLLPSCPYRGLNAFREEDAPLFFGRETFATNLRDKARRLPLVAVVGPSGSGKSSVVQAGLTPLLRRERPPERTWEVVHLTPGNRPYHRLAAALVEFWEPNDTDRLIQARKLGDEFEAAKQVAFEHAFREAQRHAERADRLLVVLDQFEELFTMTPESDRRPFVEALLGAAGVSPVTLLLTLRADFYGQAIGLSRALSDAIADGIVNISPMTRNELRRAVEEPARSVGVEFERGLVDRILDHVDGQPGNLPLLEFALTELWGSLHGTGPQP